MAHLSEVGYAEKFCSFMPVFIESHLIAQLDMVENEAEA
jgi:hypothetical protein